MSLRSSEHAVTGRIGLPPELEQERRQSDPPAFLFAGRHPPFRYVARKESDFSQASAAASAL